MTVETDSFYQTVYGLIEKASGILFPNPLFPNPLKEVALYQRFFDQASRQKGHTGLWVTRKGFMRLRVSATTIDTPDAIPPSTLVAAVDAPYTVLRLRVGAEQGIAHVFFKRSNYPGEENQNIWDLKAIRPAAEYLALLETSLAAGTLAFPSE